MLEKLKHPKDKEDDDNVSTVSGTSVTKVDSALPKINLPIFSGAVMEWVGFYDQFIAIIHNSDLPPVSKFVYLRSVLKGNIY